MNELLKIGLGVWGVLFLTGLGMKAFDWLIGWSRPRQPK